MKSIRPLYHIDKKGRPYSILTGKMGRVNSNMAKKCVFFGRHNTVSDDPSSSEF